VMSHSAGLPWVPGYEEIFGTNGEGLEKTPEILRRLEAAAREWPPGSAHGYHGRTYGWLVEELVWRVSGTSVGALVREEIAGPLDLELDLGTPVERQHQVAPARDSRFLPSLGRVLLSGVCFVRSHHSWESRIGELLRRDAQRPQVYGDGRRSRRRRVRMPVTRVTRPVRHVQSLPYTAPLPTAGIHNGYRVLTPATIEKGHHGTRPRDRPRGWSRRVE